MISNIMRKLPKLFYHSHNAFWFPADRFHNRKRPRIYINFDYSNYTGLKKIIHIFTTFNDQSPSGHWHIWFCFFNHFDIDFEFKRKEQ